MLRRMVMTYQNDNYMQVGTLGPNTNGTAQLNPSTCWPPITPLRTCPTCGICPTCGSKSYYRQKW